jgi:hypothetical protein
MTVRMKRFPLDMDGRRRAVSMEDWDQEQLSHYAAWLEGVVRKANRDLNQLPTTRHDLLSQIRDDLTAALARHPFRCIQSGANPQ